MSKSSVAYYVCLLSVLYFTCWTCFVISVGYGISFLNKQGIPYISSYNYVVLDVYQIPTYLQGIFFPGLWLRVLTFSTDANSESNIPTWHGPWQNIWNICRSRTNNIFLPPQHSAPAPQSNPTDVILHQISTIDIRSPLISVRYQSPLLSDAKDPYKISNRRHGRSDYLQLTPGLP